MSSDTDYEDIRPFHDREVSDVLSSLLQDKEFIAFLAKQTSPKLMRLVPKFIAKRVSQRLKNNLKNIDSINGLQQQLAPHIEALIYQTCDNVKVTGLDQLDPKKTYVYISNHRDIIMDPLLLNHALLSHGFNSSRIAIGDNLLSKPFIAKLMRLNKSFVVKRSVQGSRKKLAAITDLSHYIHQCLKSKHSIWLAQQSGRSKDGQDYTDSAVLKMLHLAGRKLGWDFNESMNFVNLVPVSISYEWDPCDGDKAREIIANKSGKAYQKKQDEDLVSMLKGLKLNKGSVAIHFSKPLTSLSSNSQEWCGLIDKNLHRNYEIYDSQRLAYESLNHSNYDHVTVSNDYKKRWKKRLSKMPTDVKKQVEYSYSQVCELKKNAE